MKRIAGTKRYVKAVMCRTPAASAAFAISIAWASVIAIHQSPSGEAMRNFGSISS